MRADADAAWERGDYVTARRLYTQLLESPENRAHAEARLAALTTDKLAIRFGLGTLLLIVVAYILARFL